MDTFLLIGSVVPIAAATAVGIDAARGAGRELARLTFGQDEQ